MSSAQTTPVANRPRFEVASVKPSMPGARGDSLRRLPNGEFFASNLSLRDIIVLAYGVTEFPWRFDGVPEWAVAERFDIVAKAPTAVPPVRPGSPDPILMMVRTLLDLLSLPRFVERTVIDRTGLEGSYDWQLLFSPPRSADQTGGSIFTALQEQMGLKLESTRAPVEVWFVDHLERPTPD